VDTTRFEFNVSIPRDASGAVMIRKIAEQAARYVGADARADGFGAAVEEAVRAQVNGTTAGAGALPIVVRRSDGPVEVVVGSRTIALDV
jgi:hypothetical protein